MQAETLLVNNKASDIKLVYRHSTNKMMHGSTKLKLALLFHYLLLNMFRMLVHPSSEACNLLWIYFINPQPPHPTLTDQ